MDSHFLDLASVLIMLVGSFAGGLGYIFFRTRSFGTPLLWYGFGIAVITFIIIATFQYLSFSLFIFEEARKREYIVLLRTLGVWSIWLTSLLGVWMVGAVSREWQRVLVFTWTGLFITFTIFAWMDSILLHFSGLHVTNTAFAHARGSSQIIVDAVLQPWTVGSALVVILILFFFSLFTARTLSQPSFPNRVVFTLFCVVTLFFWKQSDIWYTLPERLVIRSFIYEASASDEKYLSGALEEKMKRFGIDYSYDQFYLVNKPYVYSPSAPSLVPQAFAERPPNVLIVFLESYSARFSSVYNDAFPGVTPGLEKMASHADTTVFHNFYNASTPTATGLMSLLCSFYPPTGHLEIEHHGSLSGHRLSCLPDMLKEHLGFGYAGYMTTVDKTYAYKDRMFANMGVDEVMGTQEAARYVSGAPLSWGFSDHQIFPVFYQKALEVSEASPHPFLLMLSTIDTHPPYTFPADGVRYDDGKENILDTFHTTDAAFKKFWESFISGPLANNTVVIAVADHAAFPSAQQKEMFPLVEDINYYDETVFLMYVPQSLLPDTVDVRSSGVDLVPTTLQVLGVNVPNSFEGYSIFEERTKYPHLLGMHDLGLYINETSQEKALYGIPAYLECSGFDPSQVDSEAPLTLCEFNHFFRWKREMFQQGRFWKHDIK